MPNAKITDLADATALTGAELVETVQGGVNKKTTTQDIANLAGSSGHVIEDEGTPLTTRTKLNFVGAGVTVTDDSGDDATVVTISAGSGDDKADALITTSTKTANYTLAAGDLTSVNAGEQLVFLMNVASANDFTIPPNSSVAFPVGTVIKGVQYGAGQVTIVPDSGVTMRSPFNANKTYAQYSEFHIEKIGSDEWILGGDITA